MQEEKQLDRAKSFLILAESEAGKNLIESLKERAESITREIIAKYKSATHLDLLSLLSQLEITRDILKELDEAKEKVEILTNELKQYEKNSKNN